MIIQYNGFTPLRIVLKYQLFLCLSVEVVFIRFFRKSNFKPISTEREQAQEKNHEAKPSVQGSADPFNYRHQIG
ncbi:hypothetical protein M769_0117200 [Bacillus haynesii]|nr:hypothetical protein M769_0117200 [Bacillus haynesii]